jgi:hypothetical protein
MWTITIMDERPAKTPNVVFTGVYESLYARDTVSHVGIFDPSCVLLPLNLLPDLPPLPKVSIQSPYF